MFNPLLVFQMKKVYSFFLLLAIAASTTACFEDSRVVFAGILAEFNETVVRTPALGVTYPLIAVRNAAGQVTTRVNLVGPQQTTEQVLRVSIDPVSTAQAANYRFGGTVTIPANSSFGDLQFEVLNATGVPTAGLNLVFVLEGNETVRPSENYRRVGFRITP
jgi:hypothetical protein